MIGRMTTYSVSYGVINSLYAGTSPAGGELNGKVGVLSLASRFRLVDGTAFQYITCWARVTLPSKTALDTELGKKLWEWCEEQVKDI
jgi:hypothetical protein